MIVIIIYTKSIMSCQAAAARMEKFLASPPRTLVLRMIYIYIYIYIHTERDVYRYTYIYRERERHVCVYIYIYIYIYVYTQKTGSAHEALRAESRDEAILMISLEVHLNLMMIYSIILIQVINRSIIHWFITSSMMRCCLTNEQCYIK